MTRPALTFNRNKGGVNPYLIIAGTVIVLLWLFSLALFIFLVYMSITRGASPDSAGGWAFVAVMYGGAWAIGSGVGAASLVSALLEKAELYDKKRNLLTKENGNW